MSKQPLESDWKRYRAIIEKLRERYLEEKNRELVSLLTAPDKTPTERFWDTLERMTEEKKILKDCLDRHSRSNMFMSMSLMLRYGMLKKEDLEGFSEALQSDLTSLWR